MDSINVIELPKLGGMMRNWSQPYEITVVPSGGKDRPELDFLHKGDGITFDGVGYLVEIAKQVRVEQGNPYWTWMYQVTKDESDEPGSLMEAR